MSNKHNELSFASIQDNYRPIPFWSWNEKLEVSETSEQVRTMYKAGIGGFFMHARGGLQTDFMSEEWFDNVREAITEGKRLGMRAWAYDENGWPSGFGNGYVNGKGVRYQQKYLRISDSKPEQNVICQIGSHWFYYDVNPFYVDTLDKEVVKEFIKIAYEPYFERFGNDIEGFFTDEPQISRDGIPWSFVFEEEYRTRYGDEIYLLLNELFLPVGDYRRTRIRFWKMVTDLFSEAYFKQIYDWCNERGLKLTGHLVLEEDLLSQITTNGACMPHYEYFHIPGMDWLGRQIYDCLTARQVASVAEQIGKEAVLSETFALCGHNISFAELKGIYEWQMVRGINLLCPHLEGYSIRGIRKRDYPPAMYFQQPWWCEYDKLIDGLSREGMVLNRGKKKADVLLIHPQTTAWTCFDNDKCEGLEILNKEFISAVRQLEKKHILFHLGDESIMERHARVEEGRIIIGSQSYSKVIASYCCEFLPSTTAILEEYIKQGGELCGVSDLSYNDIVEDENITYDVRYYDDYKVHFFVNSTSERKFVKINAGGQILDFYTGEKKAFCGIHEFEPWGSLMLIDDVTKSEAYHHQQASLAFLSDAFRVSKKTINTLTLDKCDYYFDGVLQERNGYVLNICERANNLEKKVQIHQVYHIKIDYVPEKLYLICETPEMFEIYINGKILDRKADGYFLDKSLKKLDIHDLVQQGDNTISFDCDFVQSEGFYKKLRKAKSFESEKNKLSYDMEIEPIYLIGGFGVKTSSEWQKLDRDAYRYSGDFVIDKLPELISLKDIEQQGFPFFCGELELEGEVDIQGDNSVLDLDIKGINIVKLEMEKGCKTMLTDFKVSLADYTRGRHRIKMTLINNLRNMMGPHHLKEGECYYAGPFSFYKEPCVWNEDPASEWNDQYCFAEISMVTKSKGKCK